jgi:hypothetical protein
VGGPRDDVDRGLVQGEVVDSLPLAAVLGALFFPDEDLSVVASRCQDVAVLGMRPGDAPYSAFVTGWDDADVSSCGGCVVRKDLRVGCTRQGQASSHPFRVSTKRCVSPSISKILIVRSLEHVASFRP